MSLSQRSSVGIPDIPSPSLWREIVQGSATVGIRFGVSLALAPMLAGATFLGSFVISVLIPGWGRGGISGPSDELLASLMGIAGIVYMAALLWIWTRSRQPINVFWKACVYSVAITVGTLAGIAIVEAVGMRTPAEVVLNL